MKHKIDVSETLSRSATHHEYKNTPKPATQEWVRENCYGSGTILGASEKTEKVVYLEETTLVNGKEMPDIMGGVYAYDSLPIEQTPVEGDVMTVVFNGEECTAVVKVYDDVLYIGNYYLYLLKEMAPSSVLETAENTGEPFFLDFKMRGGIKYLIAEDDRYEGCTIEIKKEETIITPIDEKWLPKTGGSVPVMWCASNNRIYSDQECTTEIEDVSSAWFDCLANGKMAMLYDVDNEWTPYIITGIKTPGGGYHEVFVGAKEPFYTNGFDPNAED